MTKTASDVLIETIQAWGVDVVFGLPGDGINGIMEALRKRQDEIRFIQVRHEEAAAFMACAYAKYTGRLGCCLATSGPGGIHLLNGLYDAKLDGQPVLAITGMQFHDLIAHAHAAGCRARQAVQGRVRLQRALHGTGAHGKHCRTGLPHRPGATAVWRTSQFPVDFQEMEVKNPGMAGHRAMSRTTSPRFRRKARACHARTICGRAAEILNAGKKVAILAGRGALHATAELEAAGREAGRADRQGAAGQSCGAGRQPLHHRRASACWARSRRRRRWRSATRYSSSAVRSPTSNSCRSPGRRAASRSTSIRCASDCAIPWKSAWSAMPSGACKNCSRMLQRKD